MEKKTLNDLEKAKDLFRSWRLLEAYNIFRRYFDRLPFKPEPEHAQYIGMFARCLVELGKEWELKFYMAELEKLYKTQRTPEIGYQLGFISLLSESMAEKRAAKEYLEEVMRQETQKDLQDRAKMSLALWYDRMAPDQAAELTLINSIVEPIDAYLRPLVDIWKSKLYREMGRFEEAEAILLKVLSSLNPKDDWYGYFSARHTQAILFLKMKRPEEAKLLLNELVFLFEKHRFKSIDNCLKTLKEEIQKEGSLASVAVSEEIHGTKLEYQGRVMTLKGKCHAERILLSLLRKRLLSKEQLVKLLFKRSYDGAQDDKLIYYHIHNLRKIIGEVGLPAEAIEADSAGYRFIPEVHVAEVSQ